MKILIITLLCSLTIRFTACTSQGDVTTSAGPNPPSSSILPESQPVLGNENENADSQYQGYLAGLIETADGSDFVVRCFIPHRLTAGAPPVMINTLPMISNLSFGCYPACGA